MQISSLIPNNPSFKGRVSNIVVINKPLESKVARIKPELDKLMKDKPYDLTFSNFTSLETLDIIAQQERKVSEVTDAYSKASMKVMSAVNFADQAIKTYALGVMQEYEILNKISSTKKSKIRRFLEKIFSK